MIASKEAVQNAPFARDAHSCSAVLASGASSAVPDLEAPSALVAVAQAFGEDAEVSFCSFLVPTPFNAAAAVALVSQSATVQADENADSKSSSLMPGVLDSTDTASATAAAAHKAEAGVAPTNDNQRSSWRIASLNGPLEGKDEVGAEAEAGGTFVPALVEATSCLQAGGEVLAVDSNTEVATPVIVAPVHTSSLMPSLFDGADIAATAAAALEAEAGAVPAERPLAQ